MNGLLYARPSEINFLATYCVHERWESGACWRWALGGLTTAKGPWFETDPNMTNPNE